MLGHVWAWLRRILREKCNSSNFFFFSLFPFSGFFNKCVENKTLIAHLREIVEPLNAEGYQQTAQV